MAHQGVLSGLLQLAAYSAGFAGIVWLLFSGLIAKAGVRLGRLLHVLPPLPPAGPTNPSLEIVAADLHRIRHELARRAGDLSMTRRLGMLQAYDDRLLDACRALEVPQTLAGLPEGIGREAERMRTESRLEQAGLRLAQGRDS